MKVKMPTGILTFMEIPVNTSISISIENRNFENLNINDLLEIIKLLSEYITKNQKRKRFPHFMNNRCNKR